MDASARGKIMMKAADIIEQKASFIAVSGILHEFVQQSIYMNKNN